MRVGDFRIRQEVGLHEVSARIDWEDRARSSDRLYFRCSQRLPGDPSRYADAFLTAAAVPAMVFGEQRLTVDAPVCPALRYNLDIALGWINHWFNFRQDRLQLDVDTRLSSLPDRGTGVASFFSGGADAWAALLNNRRSFDRQHPGAINYCVVVLGLQGTVDRQNHDNALARFKPLGEALGVEFVSMETNAYSHWMDLDPGYKIWSRSFNGASLSAIGHALGHRVQKVIIGSSDNMRTLEPWGTHPLLDPCYSSHELTVEHDSVAVTRLDKIRLIAGSDMAMNALRVCDKPPPAGYLNCGQCEKCVRTLLTFEALGEAHRCKTFPLQRMTREHLLRHGSMHLEFDDYLSLVPLLEARGRDDLLQGIKVLERRWREIDLRGWLRRADRFLLRGLLARRKEKGRLQNAPRIIAPGARSAGMQESMSGEQR